MKYDVRCESCLQTYEVDKKMSETFEPCKYCNHKVKVVHLQPANFQLNGDGWVGKDANEDYRIERELRRGSK